MEGISGIFSTCFYGEDQDLHSLQMIMIFQHQNLRTKQPQILCYQI